MKGMMPKALVLDGTERSALAIVRSLGRHRLDVRVGARMHPCLASASRYCMSTVTHRNPDFDPAGYIEDIAAASPPESGEFILPATDMSMMLLITDPRFTSRLLAPSSAAYEALTDKGRLLEIARNLGITAPETVVAHTLGDISCAVERVGRPIVIKPARSRFLKDGRIYSTSVVITETPSEALREMEAAKWFPAVPALVQRFVPGTGRGLFTLFWGGRLICSFAHRRLRERPPQGGVSVLSESIHVDPRLMDQAQRLLQHVGWSGLAMVEYRVSSDGTPFLMEVNGRPWGSLQLAIDSGVDFPWLLYCAASGIASCRSTSYSLGRRLHWTLGDLDRLIMLLRNCKPGSASRSRHSNVADFLWTTLRHLHRSEVFRLSDPRPGLHEIQHWVSDVLQARRRRTGDRQGHL